MILDPRLIRNEIAHAHICDKSPLSGLEPAALAPAEQTLTQRTIWSERLDFLRAGELAISPDAIQTEECIPFSESCVETGPHFTGPKENGGPEDWLRRQMF